MAAAGSDGFDRYAELRRTSRVYRDGFNRRSATVVELLRNALAGRETAGLALLDIGTADGSMLAAFLAAFPGLQGIGLEAAPELAAEARRRGFAVVEGRAERLPFPDAQFDICTIVATLKHIPDADAALREVHRVLRAGGVLVVADPTPHGLRLGLWRGHFDARWLPNRWSLAQTKARLQQAGFEVLASRRYMPLPIDAGGSRFLERAGRLLGASRLFLQQASAARRLERGVGRVEPIGDGSTRQRSSDTPA